MADSLPPPPPGRYVLALVAIKRRQSPISGWDRLSMLLRIVHPEAHAARQFWASISLELDRPVTATRWKAMLRSFGVVDFDPGATVRMTAHRGDLRIKEHLVGECFVATVKRVTRRDRTFLDLDRFHAPGGWTKEETAAANDFELPPPDGFDPDEYDESEGTRFGS